MILFSSSLFHKAQGQQHFRISISTLLESTLCYVSLSYFGASISQQAYSSNNICKVEVLKRTRGRDYKAYELITHNLTHHQK